LKTFKGIIKSNIKPKPKLNITTKRLSRKQIIVLMNSDNRIKFVAKSSAHINNINQALKNIKLDIKANFVWTEQTGIVIITNKIASPLDLSTVETYIKNTNQIEADNVKSPCLPQLKSYLKIIRIPYIIENTNTPSSLDVVESIIKNNHIFNNIAIVLRLRVIKVLPRLDIAIIWLDIWDMQSSSRAKCLINRCFNIRSYIVMIWEANMNLGVS